MPALEETVRAATETWCVTFAAEMPQTEKHESSTCLVHLTTKTTESYSRIQKRLALSPR